MTPAGIPLRLIRAMHKWLSLVIGLQLLLWLLSGLVFNLLDPERVKGRHLARLPAPVSFDGAPTLLSHEDMLALYDGQAVQTMVLDRLLERIVYRVTLAGGSELRDAVSGRAVAVSAALARAIAERDYAADTVAIKAIAKIEAPTLETRRHRGPVWQVTIDDDDNTTLYVSATDGRLLERRNDTWRIFDFFWMLHIMDYQGRQNFNHLLVIGAAGVCLWLALSGWLLLIKGLFRQG